MVAAHDGHDGLTGVLVRGAKDTRLVNKVVLQQRGLDLQG